MQGTSLLSVRYRTFCVALALAELGVLHCSGASRLQFGAAARTAWGVASVAYGGEDYTLTNTATGTTSSRLRGERENASQRRGIYSNERLVRTFTVLLGEVVVHFRRYLLQNLSNMHVGLL